MFKKIRQWLLGRKIRRDAGTAYSLNQPDDKSIDDYERDPVTYTRDEVIKLIEETRTVAYTDGKRDGLAVAREQATKSLKEILWEQNKPTK